MENCFTYGQLFPSPLAIDQQNPCHNINTKKSTSYFRMTNFSNSLSPFNTISPEFRDLTFTLYR